MSHKYAAEYDLPQYKHVLMPRTKVTHTAITCLKDKIQSVYDICIAYASRDESVDSESVWRLLCPESPLEVHIHVNRIPIENFSANGFSDNGETSEEYMGNWLINVFEKKDAMLNRIHLKNFDLLSSSGGFLINLSLKETLPSFLLLTFTTLSLFGAKYHYKLYFKVTLAATFVSFLTVNMFSYKSKNN